MSASSGVQIVPQRLTAYRTAAGLTRPELARRIGRTYEFVWQMERGLTTPSEETFGRLVEVLGIPRVAWFEEATE